MGGGSDLERFQMPGAFPGDDHDDPGHQGSIIAYLASWLSSLNLSSYSLPWTQNKPNAKHSEGATPARSKQSEIEHETRRAPDLVPTTPWSSSHRKSTTPPGLGTFRASSTESAVFTARRATQFVRKSVSYDDVSPSNYNGYSTASRSGKLPTTPIPHSLRPTSAARFKDLDEFFEKEQEFSLLGLEGLSLNVDDEKRAELDKAKAERDHIEQSRLLAARKALRPATSECHDFLSDLTDHRRGIASVAPAKGSAQIPDPEGTSLGPKDFERLVPHTAWLNDNVIQGALTCLATAINKASRRMPSPDTTPKCVAVTPLFWTTLRDNPQGYHRRFKRIWKVTPENFLEVETFIMPINLGNHWTVIIIRPIHRTIAYVDSFHSKGAPQLRIARRFVKDFLGDARYKEDEWENVNYQVPRQTNSYDCGMFVITNSIFIALGYDPSFYSEKDMPLQRLRIAAVLRASGFVDDLKLPI